MNAGVSQTGIGPAPSSALSGNSPRLTGNGDGGFPHLLTLASLLATGKKTPVGRVSPSSVGAAEGNEALKAGSRATERVKEGRQEQVAPAVQGALPSANPPSCNTADTVQERGEFLGGDPEMANPESSRPADVQQGMSERGFGTESPQQPLESRTQDVPVRDSKNEIDGPQGNLDQEACLSATAQGKGGSGGNSLHGLAGTVSGIQVPGTEWMVSSGEGLLNTNVSAAPMALNEGKAQGLPGLLPLGGPETLVTSNPTNRQSAHPGIESLSLPNTGSSQGDGSHVLESAGLPNGTEAHSPSPFFYTWQNLLDKRPETGVSFATPATGSKGMVDVSQAVRTTGVDQPATVERVVQHIRVLSRQGGGSVQIRLSPSNLGALRLTVHVNRSSVRCVVEASSETARETLERHGADLFQKLAGYGLRLESMVTRLMIRPSHENPSGPAFTQGGHPDPGRGENEAHSDPDSPFNPTPEESPSEAMGDSSAESEGSLEHRLKVTTRILDLMA